MTTTPSPSRVPDGEFAAFILTHGRPENVITYDTLRASGYTGRIVLVVDDLDPTREKYLEKFPGEVFVFDKREIARTYDQGDNFENYKSIFYARNASFEIARRLGIRHFVQLDDDYRHFQFRFDDKLEYHPRILRRLDPIFAALLRFYVRARVDSIAIAQGGDFIGGEGSSMASTIRLKRKCMNSFFCSTDRPFRFVGRINEDVNTYTHLGSRGLLLFTTNQITLEQTQTQANPGGMTDLYLESGTFVKSFYSVMYQPSSVKIRVLYSKNPRLHHRVAWDHTVPKILREEIRKPRGPRAD